MRSRTSDGTSVQASKYDQAYYSTCTSITTLSVCSGELVSSALKRSHMSLIAG
jgi:hypothetical protein